MSIRRMLYKFQAVAILWAIGLPSAYICISFGLWTWSIYKWDQSVRLAVAVFTIMFSIIVFLVSHAEEDHHKRYY